MPTTRATTPDPSNEDDCRQFLIRLQPVQGEKVSSLQWGAGAGQPGYVLEAAIPFNFDSGNSFNADGPMGFTMYWRDRDNSGWHWAMYHQQTARSCHNDGQPNLFNTSTWGTLNFGDPLADCAGVPNGGAVLNECGECGGSIGDSDGTVDCMDSCPNDAANDADQDGICGNSDICLGFDDNGPDSDNDGTPDTCDKCSLPSDSNCYGIVDLRAKSYPVFR